MRSGLRTRTGGGERARCRSPLRGRARSRRLPARSKPSPHRVAVVQHPSVALHRDRTLKRGVALIDEAAGHGARLVAFPETWVPGYPEWLWRLRPGDDYDLTAEIHARLLENAVDLTAGQLKPLQAAARR